MGESDLFWGGIIRHRIGAKSQCCLCTNTARTAPGVTFHRFPPKGSTRRQLWMRPFLLDGNRQQTNHKSLCSEHFEESCIDRSGKMVKLRAGAIPTLFDESKRRPMEECSEPEDSQVTTVMLPKPSWEKKNNLETYATYTEFMTSEDGLKNDFLLTGTSIPLTPHSADYIAVEPEDINQEFNESDVDNAIEAKKCIFSDPDFPKTSNEECDPLSLDERCVVDICDTNENPNDHEGNALLNNSDIKYDKSFARWIGNPSRTDSDDGDSASCKYFSSMESNSVTVPIDELISEAEDESEFNEILIVKECMPIEDCSKVEEPTFESPVKESPEKIIEENKPMYNVHNEKTDNKCDVCSAVINDSYELNLHKIDCLLNWRPYSCNFCSERFWEKRMLDTHSLLHVNVQACLKCGWLNCHTNNRKCRKCEGYFRKRICLKNVWSQRQKQDGIVAKVYDQANVSNVSKVKCKQKKIQEDILLAKNCNQTNVKKVSIVKFNQIKEDIVDPKNCDLTNERKVSKNQSKHKQMQGSNLIGETKAKRVRKRIKKGSSEEVDESTMTCHTCGKYFTSATELRVHMELLFCRNKKIAASAS